jgi:DNA-binding transcriptional ArsR family regulator
MEIGLLRGKPALQVSFCSSLGVSLIDAVTLVLNAPRVEGLDGWVYTTVSQLPPALKREMETVFPLLCKCGLVSLPWDDPVHRTFDALVGWLDSLTEADCREMILDALRCHAESGGQGEAGESPLGEEGELDECLAAKLEGERLEQVRQLARDPSAFRKRLVAVVTQFWTGFFRPEYETCQPLMDRSVDHHRGQEYGIDLADVYPAVAGRQLPLDRERYDDLERVIFVPSCHVGPYGIFERLAGRPPTMVVTYNCRPTGAPRRAPSAASAAAENLFPPLKALGDETRLHILAMLDGRELYAQEIVERLGISQSAVSRHLRLMVAGGVLAVRKQENMKYYSIDAVRLGALADQLKDYRGRGT